MAHAKPQKANSSRVKNKLKAKQGVQIGSPWHYLEKKKKSIRLSMNLLDLIFGNRKYWIWVLENITLKKIIFFKNFQRLIFIFKFFFFCIMKFDVSFWWLEQATQTRLKAVLLLVWNIRASLLTLLFALFTLWQLLTRSMTLHLSCHHRFW